MPVVFVGHGSPMNAIETNPFTQMWASIGKTLPQPRSILCISAHWETRGTRVTTMEWPKTIHDFAGFPDELFQVNYPCPGNPNLINHIRHHVTGSIESDLTWGIDHGAWSVLKHMVGDPIIPVVQLSLDRSKSPLDHWKLGRELRALRSDGVLIVCSGNVVHNLQQLDWGNPTGGFDWAVAADALLTEWVLEDNRDCLTTLEPFSEPILQAVPTLEHYLPLVYFSGATDSSDTISSFNQAVILGSLSMTSFIAH